ncbi:hypothetical protein [Bacteroides congonensis]
MSKMNIKKDYETPVVEMQEVFLEQVIAASKQTNGNVEDVWGEGGETDGGEIELGNPYA